MAYGISSSRILGQLRKALGNRANGNELRDRTRTRVKKIAVTSAPQAETDSGFDIPAGSLLKAVYVEVLTAEATGATKTLDVGQLSTESSGDPNGYLAAVDVSTTGFKKGTLVNTGQTLGALLSVDEDGAGALVPEPYPVPSANPSVSYSPGSAGDWVEFTGNIYLEYLEPEGE